MAGAASAAPHKTDPSILNLLRAKNGLDFGGHFVPSLQTVLAIPGVLKSFVVVMVAIGSHDF
jgi:hypothetical protein